jgi:hypothetical protein
VVKAAWGLLVDLLQLWLLQLVLLVLMVLAGVLSWIVLALRQVDELARGCSAAVHHVLRAG